MDYNRNNNNNPPPKNTFNPKYQTETTEKLIKDASMKINSINGKPITHDNNRTPLLQKNVAVIGNSMIKHLRCEDLSSQSKNIKIVTHPGSTTNNMLNYI